ncbi:ABC-2 transporter permease [Paenibacillus sp. MWE-103]|uniref:ABC-2 transporter permease n=1 Tax=Paenibacillus artemisiicola TaxID=1172618 RepID=A0ABS3W519_9BACL|nr:ABC-2 transporter permease [Paenibacillus artemisiicola]MBO7743407.1 ABC-2 transporter permease [Paenibacillus artemisiicola]
MYNLVIKDLKIGIQPIFFVMPFLLGMLMLIPSWIYFIVPMYFFWISVPGIFGNFRAQNDLLFTTMMPVTKPDMVKARVFVIIILEMLHVGFAVIFGLIHDLVYSSMNITYYFFAPTMGFWGLCMVIMAIFNLVFLPMYYKTAYKYGGALGMAVAAAMIFAGIAQWLGIQIPTLFDVFNVSVADHLAVHALILIAGIAIFAIFTLIAYRVAAKRFLNVELL